MAETRQAEFKQTEIPAWEKKLADKVVEFIRLSDDGEERRRRFDRLGAQLFYDQHWDPNISIPDSRSASTFNVAGALIKHKASIVTKQQPIPVVTPTDAGDKEAARLMRQVLINLFQDPEADFQEKLKHAVILCHVCRTSGMKVFWDPMMRGGAGDIAFAVVPPWRMLLDQRVTNIRQMQFIGDRMMMPRSRAMHMYPQSADKIAAGGQEFADTEIVGSGGFSPIRDPYRDSPTQPDATVINGKPFITAFAAQAPSGVDTADWVQIAEIYHIDPRMERKQVPERDHLGEIIKQPVRDENGMPQFTQLPDETIHTEFGPLAFPNFELLTEPILQEKLVRVYPHYRRTTLLLPDQVVIDDRAWDGPLPYCLFNADIPLDGIWNKGPLLSCEDATNNLNVAMSIIDDNLRIGSYQVFKASDTTGLERNRLVVEPGGVIRVHGDVSQFVPLQVAQLNQEYFSYVNLLVTLMGKIIGLEEGIMQGQAAGRLDSGSAHDTLAEIGGSRVVEFTQRMAQSIADLAMAAGWFAQNFYTEKHAIAVEDNEGNLTWERAHATLLMGTFSYRINIAAEFAWSESANEARAINRYQIGLYDKVELAKRLNIENYKEIFARMINEPPALAGPGGGPPPRTRSSPKVAQGKPRGNGSIPRA